MRDRCPGYRKCSPGLRISLQRRSRCIQPELIGLVQCAAHIRPSRGHDRHRARRARPATASGQSISRRSIGAKVSVSKPFIGFSAPGDGLFDNEFEVLDPDAIGICLVVAGLVGEDHAALERHGAEFGDPRRTLMHRQITADAMPRAMFEIEAGLPEILPRETVELGAGRTIGKDRARAIARWPRSTRVKRSRISSVGSPIAMVRVTSVVPSSYCAPESISSRSPRMMRRLLLRVTR